MFCNHVNTDVAKKYRIAVERFSHYYAAHDWFAEQAEDPNLMTRRGLRPGEPLPRTLGLFDERGMPLPQQQRSHWLALQQWLSDDDQVLGFFFPEGLSPDDDALLRADLAILKGQPWSPHAFIDASLKDWPESEPYKDFSFDNAQQEMLNACQVFLDATEAQGG